MNESAFLSTEDLSKTLGLPMSFIYEHTRRGSKDRIPGIFGFGKHLRFKRDEVEKWIEKHRKK
jgi:excisionase family DNA binding protein